MPFPFPSDPCLTPQGPTTDESSGRWWRLWIDRGGGFDITDGDEVTIGGPETPGTPGASRRSGRADMAIRCDWPSRVASVRRIEREDWLAVESGWHDAAGKVAGELASGPSGASGGVSRLMPLGPEQRLGLVRSGGRGSRGGVQVVYRRPSPLSRSAVLGVLPPFRLSEPIDALVMFDQTMLIGPEPFNHLCTPGLSSQQWVMFRRQEKWWIRGSAIEPRPIEEGEPWRYEDWTMLIRASDRGLSVPKKGGVDE